MLSKITRNVINAKPKFPLLFYSSSTAPGRDKPEIYDVVVVGGGIVGVATARELLNRYSHLRMAVVEKENDLAVHQSGRNSGVIHAGIYYTPGSLKAKLCVDGLHMLYKYLDENNCPYKKSGKLIVATNNIEVKRLKDLKERALKNKVPDLEELDSEGIKKIEPLCKGIKALWSPHTGIVDYKLVTQNFADDFQKNGGEIYLNFEVNGFEEVKDDIDAPVLVRAKFGKMLRSKYLLTCAGLQSDLIARLSGCSENPKIVPFRGEYLLLKPEKSKLVKTNIYPVPDPRFPFLGVHFTPRMDGSVWLGPNAVLALKREGYTWFDFNLNELLDAVKYQGFQKLSLKYLGYGFGEVMKSVFISMQVKESQKFIPEITANDVIRGPAGVRAQALDETGNLVDDFYFDMGEDSLGKRILHCRNAPSPGATSSMAIAKMIADKLEDQFHLNPQ